MPRRGICQLCKRHRPGHRRQCVRCNKLVGPGCDPEQCLYTDYWDGTGICRECHRLARYRLLTRSTPDFLRVVIDVGFCVIKYVSMIVQIISNIPTYRIKHQLETA